MSDPDSRSAGVDARTRQAQVEARMEQVREHLRRRLAHFEPDEGFADRVVARLRPEPVEMLRWAALKLLPVSLLLALVLAAYALEFAPRQQQAPQTVASAQTQTSDALSWVLETGETAR